MKKPRGLRREYDVKLQLVDRGDGGLIVYVKGPGDHMWLAFSYCEATAHMNMRAVDIGTQLIKRLSKESKRAKSLHRG